MRFLHTADWQIGTQFGQFTAEEAAHLTEARFETVRRIATLATERNVDAILVAGDVFDQQTVSDTVIRKLFAVLVGFAGPWFMLPGNHDAALAESVWTRAMRLNCVPVNVRLLLEPGVMTLDDARLALLHAPLTQRNTYDDTTEFFDRIETPAELFRIGIAHGSVSGILQEGIDSANPLAPTRAETARLDYLALGDWHGVYEVNPRIWYAGTPEQDRFRANEPGYVLDVTIDAPGDVPAVERVRVGKYRWRDWMPEIAVSSDVDMLRQQLHALDASDVLRIRVTGSAALAEAEALHVAIEEARARVRALRASTSELKVLPTEEDLAALGARSGYLANVVTRLRELQADEATAAAASEALLLLAGFQRDGRNDRNEAGAA
ncbi:DNA double-strand break repair protein Mre11 [Candidatus Burkholderia verschuerenii]|uniref:DNA double-strand break repair protein Mre11 n=1 Tax=Candidatus Burkholderia verschuerenii TaxID=242163 RepID=A0A0L0M3H0_9BURK|nr:DNA repair exonuclease [Candidatus Burkholderia verschuerenii]KND56846.1 DNA double-strand break repair protein Mre11 [Candidatus Burkholderia verschuerenii]